MLCNWEDAPVLRAWRGLASGDLDRRDVVELRSVVAGSAYVRASGLRGLERDQLVDDVVRRLWRSAARQGPRWLDRARGNVNPEMAVRSYIASAARSELIDRARSWCGENSDLELPAEEPGWSALRDMVPVRLWAEVLAPESPGGLDAAVEARTLALFRPITAEKDRELLRLRVRCRLAAPSQVPALVAAFLATRTSDRCSPSTACGESEYRRRRNALDKAITRLATRLWQRAHEPTLRPSRRLTCQRALIELFGTILRQASELPKLDGIGAFSGDCRLACAA